MIITEEGAWDRELAARQALFAFADVDSNGSLDKTETAKAASPAAALESESDIERFVAFQADELMTDFDADGDGVAVVDDAGGGVDGDTGEVDVDGDDDAVVADGKYAEHDDGDARGGGGDCDAAHDDDDDAAGQCRWRRRCRR